MLTESTTPIDDTTLIETEDIQPQKKEYKLPLTENESLLCLVGYRKNGDREVWECHIPRQDLSTDRIKVYGTNGEQINTATLTTPVSITEIDTIVTENNVQVLRKGDWGNPCLYRKRPENKINLESEFHRKLQVGAQIWEAALEGEERVKQVISELVGEPALQSMLEIITVLEKFPEIQLNKYNVQDLDLRTIAATATNDEEIRSKLLKNSVFDNNFRQTELFTTCFELVKRIQNHEVLTSELMYFNDAITYSKATMDARADTISSISINEISRPVVLAQLVENLLCRSVVPEDIFRSHQQEFIAVKQMLEKEGYEFPQWFEPYAENQFVWRFSLDRRIANAAGFYFVDATTDGVMAAHVLSHEKIHKIAAHAHDIGLNGLIKNRADINLPREKYAESFTESLALLLMTGGNIDKAITMCEQIEVYKAGVLKYLQLLKELATQRQDPFAGIKLMIDGMKQTAAGETFDQSQVVRQAWDEIAVEIGRQTFDEEMSDYQDRELYRALNHEAESIEFKGDFTELREWLIAKIGGVLFEDFNRDELRKAYIYDEKDLQRDKANFVKIMEKNDNALMNILYPDAKGIYKVALSLVQENSEKSAVLATFLQSRYRPYVDQLSKYAETGKKTN